MRIVGARRGVLAKSKALQLGIARTAPRELALIKKELAGRHGTKLRRWHRSQFLLQPLEDFVGTVALAPARSARGAALSSKGQVRAERTLFLRNAKPGGYIVDCRSQLLQFGSGFNS